MSKKSASLILSLVLAAGMIGSTLAEEGDQLSRIRQSGEIIVATEGAWAPWTYHDEADQLVGFDVEVAQAIAEKLGVTARFVESEWDGIFAGLDARRYDIAANGVEVTGERAEKYDFTIPYGYIRTALIVRGDNTDIASFEDLAGKRTANSIASTYMTLAESYGAQAVGVDTLDQTIDMVLSGRADATLNAEVSFYDYLRVHPDANIKVVALTEEASQVALPVRKGEDSATLLEALNQTIAELAAEGTLKSISEKYFGSDISGANAEAAEEEEPMISMDVNGTVFPLTLADTDTARAFEALLPMTLSMDELNGNEKYHTLSAGMPSAAQSVGSVAAGDLMLYGSDCVVLFYEGFSTGYAYTRIGTVNDPAGLKEALGQDSVTVTFNNQ